MFDINILKGARGQTGWVCSHHDKVRVVFFRDGAAARLRPESPSWLAASHVYLARFPEAEPMTHLDDFSFVVVYPTAARQVAGFGSARPLDEDDLTNLLRPLQV